MFYFGSVPSSSRELEDQGYVSVHPGKLTNDNGKKDHLKMYLLLKMVIFHAWSS